MNVPMLLSTPTAKIQIGNQASITLDTTSSSQGKKSIQIKIVTENDSISKTIHEIANEVSHEIESATSEISYDRKQDFYEKQLELERLKNESMTEKIEIILPIIAILAFFGYSAFKSYQKRKWKEALLMKGFSIEEIQAAETTTTIKSGNTDEFTNYNKRKMLKYALVFGSLGIAILLGSVMDDFSYFIGTLFLLLGAGFWYYNEQFK